MKKIYKNKILIFIVSISILFLLLPVPKFTKDYSTVLYSSNGKLLGATISKDEQWRFPPSNNLSNKYIECLLEYEDKYFFVHRGINPVSIISAAISNIKQGKIVRGGSTLSMQVVRLARKNKDRTIKEKFIEAILALRLEFRYSKEQILYLYAANAPFGGNVVGIDAAAWRYFNTTPDMLTWSEAATLAVLPNSPSLIHLGKNREALEIKRNKLLNKLLSSKSFIPKKYRSDIEFNIDEYELAILEKIPPKPFGMPQLAYHYLQELGDKKGEKIISDIDYNLQVSIINILNKNYQKNSPNGIENSAVYVLDYIDNNIVGYVGNNINAKDAAMVNMITANRSTGSVLKPFLYAKMLDEGILMPNMIIPDIPINISGYIPKNYSGEYWGAVTAGEALVNSLNSPFVYLLKEFGVSKFCDFLKNIGLSGIIYDADHYGLSLILGGGEASLFDVTNVYGKMAKTLYLNQNDLETKEDKKYYKFFSPSSIMITFNELLKLNRPYEQIGWEYFTSTKNVAWKTGTSFGNKDAWSIGVIDRYVVGVWVGNASGEGRSGLTGVNTAAPILFDVLDKIKGSYTYQNITSDAVEVTVCAKSGYPPNENCPEIKIVLYPDIEIKTGVCPYHKKIFLDKTNQFQVLPNCYDVDKDNYQIYFVLPPVMEWFYKQNNITYINPPPLYPGCNFDNMREVMEFIYPNPNTQKIILPIGITGEKQSVVFHVAHRNPNKKIYWFLDKQYLGETSNKHQMLISENPGTYCVKCVDEDGNEIKRIIEIR
ncbi:MAG: penicillin-binding protein 1C [Bacteroidales bacterium]|jgi:penicillin-binding protein 1C